MDEIPGDYGPPPPFEESPVLALIYWITIILVIILPVAHVFRKADDGEFDNAGAMLTILWILILSGWATVTRGSWGMLFPLGIVLWFYLIVPWIGGRYTKVLHKQIDDRYIEKCRLAVQLDSRNAGAHALLADACAARQEYTEAVAHYEAALTLAPDPLKNPEYKKWNSRLEASRVEKRKQEAKGSRRLRF